MAEKIGSEDIDAIREILNIGIGRSAHMLNRITKSHIILSIPEVSVYNIMDLTAGAAGEKFDEDSATVSLGFNGVFSGITAVAFPKDSAAKLVMAMTGEEAGTPELDSLRVETLKEVGNIIINGVMGSISNILKTHIEYAIPSYAEAPVTDLINSGNKSYDDDIIMAVACFRIKDLDVEGNIFMLLEIGSMQVLIENINRI